MVTYCDKTWCVASCNPTINCGRKLSDEDKRIITEEKWVVSLADFSSDCEFYTPGDKEVADAVKRWFQETY